jgi:uncharacterized protein with NRDE domain
MCLILVALDSHPAYPLIVAANRDEFYQRPTAPAAFWPETPSVLAGRDLQAGGTWLGIERHGRFAAVTNYRQGAREPAAVQSRGSLVRVFLQSATAPQDYVRRVAQDAELYNGFNLLAGDHRELWYFSNREGVPRLLPPGVYGLSNHLLDTAWPKVASGKSTLEALVREGEPELIGALLGLLSDRTRPADAELPRTGVAADWERLLSSAFISSDTYGTRSSTVVLVGRDRRVTFVERGFESSGAPGEQRRFEFTLEAPPSDSPGGRPSPAPTGLPQSGHL